MKPLNYTYRTKSGAIISGTFLGTVSELKDNFRNSCTPLTSISGKEVDNSSEFQEELKELLSRYGATIMSISTEPNGIGLVEENMIVVDSSGHIILTVEHGSMSADDL